MFELILSKPSLISRKWKRPGPWRIQTVSVKAVQTSKKESERREPY